ncbi:MAG: alpha/beta hydrolase [Proteobacteria bacterium]|nr:alpha/beta hydrolase [Pseudomonadota bacterium]
MPLDPQVRPLLDALGSDLDLETLAPDVFRKLFRQLTGTRGGPDLSRVEDRSVPGPGGDVRVRLYADAAPGPLPTVVYFHGGGFVVGDLDTHDTQCRHLAREAGCAVVAVDYRLAPEHPFPAGVDDALAVTRWLAERGSDWGLDPGRLAVAGDSAGGNLAAVTALRCRTESGPSLRHQLLVYPVTDHAFDTPSYAENAEGYFLTRNHMRWFWGHYLAQPQDGERAEASPLRAPDLSGLAPATVVTAEFDPLRDEGEAYAARLREAGNEVHLERFDGMIHGFFGMQDAVDRAREALALAASRLRAAFAAG